MGAKIEQLKKGRKAEKAEKAERQNGSRDQRESRSNSQFLIFNCRRHVSILENQEKLLTVLA